MYRKYVLALLHVRHNTKMVIILGLSHKYVTKRHHSVNLPLNAQSAVMPRYVVVRLSVTFKYCDHIGWNTSKIILPNSLGYLLGIIQTSAIWPNGMTPEIRLEYRARVQKTCDISETVHDMIKVTITEFRGEVNREKARVMGLSSSEDRMSDPNLSRFGMIRTCGHVHVEHTGT